MSAPREALNKNGGKGRLLALSSTGFLVVLGFSLIVPVLPLYAKSFGATTFQVGAIVAGFALARMAFSLPAGVLLYRLSHRFLIVLGLVIVAGASVLIGFATNYETILLGRVISGFGSAFYLTASTAYLASITTARTRGRFLSTYDTVQRAGFVLGPLLGGLAAHTYSLGTPFLIYALFLSAATVPAYLGIKAVSSGPKPEPEAGVSVGAATLGSRIAEVKRLYRDRSLLTVNLATFSIFFVLTGLNMTVIPIFASENLRLSELALGAAFTVYYLAYTAALLPAGFLSDRYGRKPFMMLSLIVSGAVLALMPSASTPLQFTLAMAAYGASMGLAGNLSAWVSDLAPSGKLNLAIGLSRTVNDLGVVAGPIALSLLGGLDGGVSASPFLAGSAILLLFGLLLTRARDPARLR